MRLKLPVLLAVGAAAAAFATAAPSSAVAAPAAGGPPVHVINLHQAYQSALPRAAVRNIAGVVPPRGRRVSAPASRAVSAPSACVEPNCDLTYNGGPVQHSPRVYLLLWGPGWSTPAATAASAHLASLYEGLGVTSDDTWSTITSQYGDASGRPAFTGSVFAGTFNDTAAPPASVTQDNLAAEASALATQQGITDLADAQIVVASQPGTCFGGDVVFVGNCGAIDPNGQYCAYHSSTTGGLSFTNLPYQLDAGADCGENWINSGAAGTYDGFSTVAAHEYSESVTDPEVDSNLAWVDLADTISGGEIGDKCAWGGTIFGLTDPAGNITLSTGTFAMQSLWSNAAGRCVMTSAPRITVTRPATQKSILGRAVSLQIRASSNTHTALSYRASGLPAGLAINGSTGRITGKPGTTAGTFRTKVTVSDYAGSAAVSFAWQVSSAAGPVKGYAAKCADDHAGRTANGNKIDLWSCDGLARQRMTFTASGQLRVLGKCVTAVNGATVLEPCAGSAAQTWIRRATGVYVVKSSRRCLTDPGNATANGTQLRLAACVDAAGQRWSLP